MRSGRRHFFAIPRTVEEAVGWEIHRAHGLLFHVKQLDASPYVERPGSVDHYRYLYIGARQLSTMAGESGPSTPSAPPIMDYEGSRYRTEFWEGQGRNYEDATERLALQRLLPRRGRRIAEIGAGFGRLADLYSGYDQVILFDYSRTLLQEAVERWGHDPRFVFVAGNIYQLSLAKASLDSLVMVRVMHHLADVPRALAQIRRVLHRDSVAVLEYANKRNLKALVRWAMGRQSWSPHDPAPVEFVALNYDFHPAWMWEQFSQAKLTVRRQLAVSHFRTPVLKRTVPTAWLAKADSWLFALGGRYPLSPSVFIKAVASGEDNPSMQMAEHAAEDGINDMFCCPVCGSDRTLVHVESARLRCAHCETVFAKRDGIWDFKEPLD